MDAIAQPTVVLITAPSQTQAQEIAHTLVANHLAACVTLIPVHSIYSWEGKIHQDEEWQLVIKTDLQRFTELEAAVRTMHPYEVPEIIALPIQAGSQPYLQWIRDQVKQ
jgi:periplasmic divalent cation tolerance protein